MSRLASELTTLGTAVMFLTRLPTGRWNSGAPETLAQATRYFPLVGLLVGFTVGTALYALGLFLPPLLASCLAVAVSLLVTGAFHEDGLADVADSAGVFALERKLEIMRDSRIGTYGAAALGLALLTRVLVFSELLQRLAAVELVMVLVSAHALARWSSLWLMFRYPYARAEAANRALASGVTRARLLEGSMFMALVLLIMVSLWPGTWVLWPTVWLLMLGLGRLFLRWFGGITGDCLGAANLLVELAVLLLIAVLGKTVGA